MPPPRGHFRCDSRVLHLPLSTTSALCTAPCGFPLRCLSQPAVLSRFQCLSLSPHQGRDRVWCSACRGVRCSSVCLKGWRDGSPRAGRQGGGKVPPRPPSLPAPGVSGLSTRSNTSGTIYHGLLRKSHGSKVLRRCKVLSSAVSFPFARFHLL